MRALHVVTGLALTVALAGCSNDDDKKADESKTPAASSTASGTPSSSAPAEKTYSPAQLKGTLLALNDMPESGFTAYDDDPADRNYYCDYTPPKKPTHMVGNQFEKVEGISIFLVKSGIDQYATAADAKANFDKMLSVLQSCKKDTDDDGNEFTYKAMSGPRLGDESTAIEITGEIDGVDLVMHQFYTLTGTAMIQTSAAVGGMQFPNADEISQLAETVFNRYAGLS